MKKRAMRKRIPYGLYCDAGYDRNGHIAVCPWFRWDAQAQAHRYEVYDSFMSYEAAKLFAEKNGASLLPVDGLQLGHVGSGDSEGHGFVVVEGEVGYLTCGLCHDDLVVFGLPFDHRSEGDDRVDVVALEELLDGQRHVEYPGHPGHGPRLPRAPRP